MKLQNKIIKINFKLYQEQNSKWESSFGADKNMNFYEKEILSGLAGNTFNLILLKNLIVAYILIVIHIRVQHS